MEQNMKDRINKHMFFHEAYDGTKITVESEAVSLPDLLECFEQYLKGCGFSFEGHVDIINEDLTPAIVDDEE